MSWTRPLQSHKTEPQRPGPWCGGGGPRACSSSVPTLHPACFTPAGSGAGPLWARVQDPQGTRILSLNTHPQAVGAMLKKAVFCPAALLRSAGPRKESPGELLGSPQARGGGC